MDRQLAQRMVGAACLLAVLVLIVPAILDGNPESGARVTHPVMDDSLDLRTHTIRLDGEERLPPVPTAAEPQVPPTPSDASVTRPAEAVSPPPAEPSPAQTLPAQASPAPPPSAAPAAAAADDPVDAQPREPVRPLAREPVVQKPVTQPKTTERQAGTSAERGSWFVQLGSFSQQENARRLVADLKRKGFPAAIDTTAGAKGTLYRVRTAPVHDRAAADALAGQLTKAGFAGGRVGQQ